MEDTVYPLDGKKGFFLGEVDSVTLTPHKRPSQQSMNLFVDGDEPTFGTSFLERVPLQVLN